MKKLILLAGAAGCVQFADAAQSKTAEAGPAFVQHPDHVQPGLPAHGRFATLTEVRVKDCIHGMSVRDIDQA